MTKTEKCYRVKHTDSSGLQYFDVELVGQKALEGYLWFLECRFGQRVKETALVEEYTINIYQ